jgi:hypothetical protein
MQSPPLSFLLDNAAIVALVLLVLVPLVWLAFDRGEALKSAIGLLGIIASVFVGISVADWRERDVAARQLDATFEAAMNDVGRHETGTFAQSLRPRLRVPPVDEDDLRYAEPIFSRMRLPAIDAVGFMARNDAFLDAMKQRPAVYASLLGDQQYANDAAFAFNQQANALRARPESDPGRLSIAKSMAADYLDYMKYAGNLYLRLCLLRNDGDARGSELAGVQAYEATYDDRGEREFRVGIAECDRIPGPQTR